MKFFNGGLPILISIPQTELSSHALNVAVTTVYNFSVLSSHYFNVSVANYWIKNSYLFNLIAGNRSASWCEKDWGTHKRSKKDPQCNSFSSCHRSKWAYIVNVKFSISIQMISFLFTTEIRLQLEEKMASIKEVADKVQVKLKSVVFYKYKIKWHNLRLNFSIFKSLNWTLKGRKKRTKHQPNCGYERLSMRLFHASLSRWWVSTIQRKLITEKGVKRDFSVNWNSVRHLSSCL